MHVCEGVNNPLRVQGFEMEDARSSLLLSRVAAWDLAGLRHPQAPKT